MQEWGSWQNNLCKSPWPQSSPLQPSLKPSGQRHHWKHLKSGTHTTVVNNVQLGRDCQVLTWFIPGTSIHIRDPDEISTTTLILLPSSMNFLTFTGCLGFSKPRSIWVGHWNTWRSLSSHRVMTLINYWVILGGQGGLLTLTPASYISV